MSEKTNKTFNWDNLIEEITRTRTLINELVKDYEYEMIDLRETIGELKGLNNKLGDIIARIDLDEGG